jgi:hypothetical protein
MLSGDCPPRLRRRPIKLARLFSGVDNAHSVAVVFGHHPRNPITVAATVPAGLKSLVSQWFQLFLGLGGGSNRLLNRRRKMGAPDAVLDYPDGTLQYASGCLPDLDVVGGLVPGWVPAGRHLIS